MPLNFQMTNLCFKAVQLEDQVSKLVDTIKAILVVPCPTDQIRDLITTTTGSKFTPFKSLHLTSDTFNAHTITKINNIMYPIGEINMSSNMALIDH
jgi:hypothetical protein